MFKLSVKRKNTFTAFVALAQMLASSEKFYHFLHFLTEKLTAFSN